MGLKMKVWKQYKVNFLLTFVKADNPTPLALNRVMSLLEPRDESKIKEFFERELQRSIAGINEFPIDEVIVEVISIHEIVA